MDMPAVCPPILITQHMPPRFTAAFAERLNRECPMKVSEAVHHEVIEPNHAYIAAGSHHLELARFGGRYHCALRESAIRFPVIGRRSTCCSGRSRASPARPRSAAILTGMGKDGADGMLELRQAGAVTLGQDEASSLVYGMPRVAFERGAVMRQYPLSRMADAILDACESGSQAPQGAQLIPCNQRALNEAGNAEWCNGW